MAARKPGKVAAPVKQKLRKSHGPKRKMFHCWDSTMRMHFAKAGLLNKYNNYESFALSCAARGIKKFVPELWADYVRTTAGSVPAQKNYFETLKAHANGIEEDIANQSKKGKKGAR